LKSRKGRVLSLDEINHVCIVAESISCTVLAGTGHSRKENQPLFQKAESCVNNAWETWTNS
jgi:hypothetical protein